MINTSIMFRSALCFVLLPACGGSSTGGNSETSAPTYETLLSTSARTSTFGGLALRSNTTNNVLDIVKTNGQIAHSTGKTTISDGTYSLTDTDGFNGGNSLTDGRSTITQNTDAASGTYEYVTLYDQSYIDGESTYDSVGIGGIVTRAQDIPSGGNATYKGDAFGVIVTATQGFDLEDGTSTVSADFSSGSVDVTMSGFNAINQSNGRVAAAPIDTISATGMTISGNGFSGGTVTTTSGSTLVDLAGENASFNSQGVFFGFDATTSNPDEVGGLVLIQGDTGIVTGGFIAD